MYISKSKILNEWFTDLFDWLEKCETVFDFQKLVDYDTGRLLAYLAKDIFILVQKIY